MSILFPLARNLNEANAYDLIIGLRQKLKAQGAPDDFIETVHGLGYRLKEERL